MMNTPTTILFAGYAPVHFVCFQPIYEALKRSTQFSVLLSGGLRSEVDGEIRYDLEALYEPFGIAREELVTVEELNRMRFDVAFSAQTNMICPEVADHRVQVFHGISFRNRSIRPENMGYDHYFLAFNPCTSDVFQCFRCAFYAILCGFFKTLFRTCDDFSYSCYAHDTSPLLNLF